MHIMDLNDLMKEVNRLEKELVRTEKKLEDAHCENEKLRQELMTFKNAQESTKDGFLVVLDTDDENEYNNPPEFVFENYQKMWDFVHMVLLYGEKDLKVIITKGVN